MESLKAEKTFAEVYSALDAAFTDTKTKKKAYDDAVDKAATANNEYLAALAKATELRGMMNRILDESIPQEQIKSKIG